MRLLLILLCSSFFSVAQVPVSGKVVLCDNFSNGITLKGKLSYQFKKQRKGGHLRVLDTLRPDIKVMLGDRELLTTRTEVDGRFSFPLPENNTYRIYFFLAELIRRDTLIRVENFPVSFQICIPDTALHNYFLTKIPFDSLQAQSDIARGLVQIITLNGTYTGSRRLILNIINADDRAAIEKKYGFIFQSYYVENMFQHYLDQKESEYNKVVYRYLDRVNGTNSKESIKLEIREALGKRKKDRAK